MASNVIKVVIDVVKDSASTSLASLKTDLANTEGAFGKMKVAGTGAMGAIGPAIASGAAAAAGALVAFGVKGVAAFQDTALEAGRFSDVMGGTSEEASRWLAVVKPLGVEMGDLSDVFNNLAGLVDTNDQALQALGVTIAKDSSGRVNMSETVLNIVEALGKVEDPARRAALMAKFFGEEGSRQLAPLVAQSEKLREKLAAVSEAKVIDAGELKKAEEFRDAMKKLSDQGEDLALTVGESLVPVLTDLAEVAGSVSDALSIELPGGIKVIDAMIEPFASKFRDLAKAIQLAKGEVLELEGPAAIIADRLAANAAETALVTAETQTSTAAYSEFSRGMIDAGGNVVDFDHTLVDMGKEADRSRDAIERMSGSVSRLQGLLSDRDAYDNAIRAQNELIWANQIAIDTAKNQKATEEEKATALDASKEALRRSIDETLTYIDTVGGIPPSQETIIKAFLDEGKLAEAEAWLAHLARARTAVITAKGQGSLGFMKDDAGGHIPSGEIHEVAEKRAEFVNGVLIAGPADVTSGAQTGRILGSMRSAPATGGGGMNIVINMPPGANGQDVVNAIRKYERTAGNGWRS
jgi:hypothetical protein